jgi:hypothetical protein
MRVPFIVSFPGPHSRRRRRTRVRVRDRLPAHGAGYRRHPPAGRRVPGQKGCTAPLGRSMLPHARGQGSGGASTPPTPSALRAPVPKPCTRADYKIARNATFGDGPLAPVQPATGTPLESTDLVRPPSRKIFKALRGRIRRLPEKTTGVVAARMKAMTRLRQLLKKTTGPVLVRQMAARAGWRGGACRRAADWARSTGIRFLAPTDSPAPASLIAAPPATHTLFLLRPVGIGLSPGPENSSIIPRQTFAIHREEGPA